MKKGKGMDYMWLALTAFLGLGMEAAGFLDRAVHLWETDAGLDDRREHSPLDTDLLYLGAVCMVCDQTGTKAMRL